MSTGVIFGRVQAAWPASMGRVAGIVYLLYFVTAILAQFLLSKSPAKRSARAALLECNEGARRTLCGLVGEGVPDIG
jgi:Fe2+ transport system protein B